MSSARSNEGTSTSIKSLDAVRTAIGRTVPPMRPRMVPILDCLGATLAAPVYAHSPLPAIDLSAMDGYAVAGIGPWRLRGDVQTAGGIAVCPMDEGTAVRIATGAQLPIGAEAVIRDEYVHTADEFGLLARDTEAPIHDDVRRRGECWTAGHELATGGTRVSAAVISAALSAEVRSALVRGAVRAQVLLTGDEISSADDLVPGHTRDSLGPILPSVLAGIDIVVSEVAHVHDTYDGLLHRIAAAIGIDMVVIVGATGRGAADHMRDVLRELGANTIADGIDIRPGGSQLASILPDGRIVLGLPGNPLAAIASLLATGPALVDALTGRDTKAVSLGVPANPQYNRADRTRLVPATRQADGRWQIHTSGSTAHLGGLIGADAFAVVPVGHSGAQAIELILLDL